MSKKYSEKVWIVTLKTDSGSTSTIKLYDGNSILGEYIQIRRNYFDDLIKEIKLNRAYSVGKNIHKVVSYEGDDWTENPMILLMARNKEKDVPLWLLIKRENNLNGFLVAIGPEIFCEYLVKESERIEEIRKFLEYLVTYSQKWVITTIIPSFLT